MEDKQQTDDDHKECNFCAEPIRKNAKVCRYCDREQNIARPVEPRLSDIKLFAEETTSVQKEDQSKQIQFNSAIQNRNFARAVSLLPTEYALAYQAESTRITRGVGVAYLLLLLTWFVGGHKFYIRETGWGLAYLAGGLGSWLLVLTIVGIPAAIFFGIVLFLGSFMDLFLLPSQVCNSNDKARLALLQQLGDDYYGRSADFRGQIELPSNTDYTTAIIIVAAFCFIGMGTAAVATLITKYSENTKPASPTAEHQTASPEGHDWDGDEEISSYNQRSDSASIPSPPDDTSTLDSSSSADALSEENASANISAASTTNISAEYNQIDAIIKDQMDSKDAAVSSGLNTLLTRQPRNLPNTPESISANDKGLGELRKGNNIKAVALLKEAVKLNSTNPKYFNNLGLAELNALMYEDAQRHFQQAIRLEPMKTIAWGNLAVVFAKQGKKQQAISTLLVAAKTSEDKCRKFISDLDYTDPAVQEVANEALSLINDSE